MVCFGACKNRIANLCCGGHGENTCGMTASDVSVLAVHVMEMKLQLKVLASEQSELNDLQGSSENSYANEFPKLPVMQPPHHSMPCRMSRSLRRHL